MRKIQASVAFLLVMALVMVPPRVENGQSSPTTRIEIDPETTVVWIGKSFTIDVNISDAVDIYGLQFVLRYDPNILNATDVVLPVGGDFIIDGEPLGVPTVWDGYDCDVVPDGVLDICDLVAWANAVGTSDPRADINNDNFVDTTDFYIFREAWMDTFVDIPGTIFFTCLPLGAWEGGTFTTVTFEALGLGETVLDLDNTKLCSVLVEPIPHQLSDGNVQVRGLSAWDSRCAPTIDGEIHVLSTRRVWDRFTHRWIEFLIREEWFYAAKVDFTLTYEGEVHDATLYVMNDNINLYLALEVRNEDYFGWDKVFFNFDNDNDGVRELGDNVLYFRSDVYFLDLYIYDAVNGWTERDDLDGGTIDGFGASSFTAQGNYNFEIAFPLNTSDDTHDFDLSFGSTVGFNLEFTDYGVGSDTWPSPLWSEMAVIEIATPPPLTPSDADLRLTGVEVTQAVQHLNNSMPFVIGKTTIARAYVDIGPVTDPIDVTVFLYGLDGASEKPLGALQQSFSAPRNPDRGTITHTANFLLPTSWVNRDSLCLTLKGFVKASSAAQSETNYDNNWMVVDGVPELALIFNRTRSLNIHVVPINLTWADPQLPTSQEISEQEEYLRAIYPVADVNFIREEALEWSGHSKSALIADLIVEAGNLNNGQGIQFPDQIFGILPTSVAWGGKSNPNWNIPGYDGSRIAACGTRAGSTSLEGLMAHEIIHNLGPGNEDPPGVLWGWGLHTFSDDLWPYPDDTINEYGTATAWGWPPLVIPPDTPEIMSYDQSGTFPTKWISPYRWANMFYLLADLWSPSSTADQSVSNVSTKSITESLQIRGWVSQNGTGSLRPLFRLPVQPLQPEGVGNCSIELLDAGGNPLLIKSFEPMFVDPDGEEEDPYHFAMFLPYQDGTARVVLKWKGDVIDTVEMSENAPVVEVLSPNGGEVWSSSVQTVEWTAYDYDNNTLTYMMYYSADGGSTWTLISPTITQTSYQVDTSFIPGSDTALIRVVASDGFNTAKDESDAAFTVTDKPPTAMILQPANESRFLMDDVILLRGRGTDADDGILPATAFNWTSSLDGYLGNGTTLTTMLTPGTHQINLTVTDSKGNTARDTAVITVTLDVDITSVTPSRTVVGQGLSIQISVTAQNPSRITQEFVLRVNVTATASNLTYPIDQLEVTLPPGNSTTLALTWNTTGFSYGNYTVSAIAETDTATITLIDGIVFVTIPGDVDGDRGVDASDLFDLNKAYGSTPNKPNWNPNCDLNDDYKVDASDLFDLSKNYGKTV